MSRAIRLIAVMTLVVAACGGGDDAATTTVAATGDGSATTSAPSTTATTTTAAPVDSGAGASSDFCGFLTDYADDLEGSFMSLNPSEIEGLFDNSLDVMRRAEGMAPSEIRGDVTMFVDAYAGFVDFMDDHGFNFMAMSEDDLDDPRLLAMEDPELEAAGDRIADFCGIEDDLIATPPPSDGTSGGGGTGGLPGASLPDDFPSDLVPPNSDVLASFNVSGATSVTLEVDSPIDDVIAFYADAVGDPTIEMNEPKGALWTTQYEGSTVNIIISEIPGGGASINVTIE